MLIQFKESDDRLYLGDGPPMGWFTRYEVFELGNKLNEIVNVVKKASNRIKYS